MIFCVVKWWGVVVVVFLCSCFLVFLCSCVLVAGCAVLRGGGGGVVVVFGVLCKDLFNYVFSDVKTLKCLTKIILLVFHRNILIREREL